MSARPDETRRLRSHLESEAPTRAPDWILGAVLATIDTTPQRHRRVPRRIHDMPISLRLLALAATLAALMLGPITLWSPGADTPAPRSLPPVDCPDGTSLPSGTIATIAGTGTRGSSGDGGPALEATLTSWDTTIGSWTTTGLTGGITIDRSGAILFSDLGSSSVRRVDTDGTISTVTGPATGSPIVTPGGLATGDAGELYIADPGAARIWRLDPPGTIASIAGTGTPGSEGDDGPADRAQVQARTVLLGPQGELYIDDLYRIRAIDPDGTIRTVAGTGERGFTPDGASALTGMLGEGAVPAAVDADGSIYVADPDSLRVRRIDPDGVITTVAGGGRSGLVVEGGSALDATLSGRPVWPFGVALDGEGGFFFSEPVNNRVWHVDTAGIITTAFGGGAQLGDCLPVSEAFADAPQALALDERGLFVVDGGSNRIRVITR
jgi:sugar lactone lactonase YvrE